jgi:CHAT domain-containing protein
VVVPEWERLDAEVERLNGEGRYAEAIPLAEQGVFLAEKGLGSHHPDVAESLSNLAELYRAQGRYGEAELLVQRALGIREQALGSQHPLVAESLNHLTVLYLDQGRYGEAEPLAQRALGIREQALGSQHPLVAESLHNLGGLYRAQGRYGEAEPLVQRALGIREQALGSQHPDVAQSLHNLAALYQAQGRYGEAEPLLRRALGIHEKVPGAQYQFVAESLTYLAALYDAQGRYGEAEPLQKRALGIFEQALGAQHPLVAQSLNNLAALYDVQGRYGEAEPLYVRALGIFEQLLGDQHLLVAASLNNLAGLYLEQGRYGEAEPLYVRSLKIREQALGGQHPDVAQSSSNLAGLYLAQRRYEEAEPLLQRGLGIREQALGDQHPHVALSLNNLAGLYREQGRYGEAEPLYVRSLDIREKTLDAQHPDVALGLNNLAGLYREQGRYGEAERLYVRALDIREKVLGAQHPHVALTLSNLARLYFAQKDIDRAIAHAERAERASNEHLSAMMRHGSEHQRHAFMAKNISEVDRAVTLALRAPVDARAQSLAFRHLLRRSGRVLDAMRSTLVVIRDHLDDEGQALLDRYLSIRSQYATQYLRGPRNIAPEQHEKNLADLEKQKRETEVELSAKSSQFAEANRPVTLDDVQNALTEDAALIQWIRYEPFDASARPQEDESQAARYAACVLARRGGPTCLDLGDAEAIDTAAVAFHRAAALGLESRAPARALEALIMTPVRRSFGRARKLYLSPDGALQFIPFAALVHQDGTAPERYLVEEFDLVYVTSGRDLVRAPRTGVTPGPVTVLGDPRYSVPSSSSGYRFPRLPGTRPEAEEIGVLFTGARVLTDADASEAAVKSTHAPSILHLATHAYFGAQDCAGQSQVTDNPLLAAGLALAGANACNDGSGGDGVLTGEELAGLDLYGTQLVVLSACDTGIGALALRDQTRLIGVRDGVYGLRRALMLAGAETQVVSLWKVNDLATQELMAAYYRALLQGRGRAEALRQVQLAMLRSKERSHPYYWASFAVVGMDGPLRLPPGQAHPGTTPRGTRGCACDVGAGSPAPGWATLVLALAVVVALRSRLPIRCRRQAVTSHAP